MTYPKYFKTTAHNVKVLSETNSLWVTKTRTEEHDWDMQDDLKYLKATESTETEFKKAFNKTSKYLKSLI